MQRIPWLTIFTQIKSSKLQYSPPAADVPATPLSDPSTAPFDQCFKKDSIPLLQAFLTTCTYDFHQYLTTYRSQHFKIDPQKITTVTDLRFSSFLFLFLSLSLTSNLYLSSHLRLSSLLLISLFISISLLNFISHVSLCLSLSLSLHNSLCLYLLSSLMSHTLSLSLFISLSFSCQLTLSLRNENDHDHLFSRLSFSLSLCTHSSDLPCVPECVGLGPFVDWRVARSVQKVV